MAGIGAAIRVISWRADEALCLFPPAYTRVKSAVFPHDQRLQEGISRPRPAGMAPPWTSSLFASIKPIWSFSLCEPFGKVGLMTGRLAF